MPCCQRIKVIKGRRLVFNKAVPSSPDSSCSTAAGAAAGASAGAATRNAAGCNTNPTCHLQVSATAIAPTTATLTATSSATAIATNSTAIATVKGVLFGVRAVFFRGLSGMPVSSMRFIDNVAVWGLSFLVILIRNETLA